MVWMKISRELTWCQQGLVNFYHDYPENHPPSENSIAEGIRQMQMLFFSRDWRQASALADIARQRLIYDEEQRFFRYALHLLLKPREYHQSPMNSREAYFHACLFKVLVEQNIYNFSPFLQQTSMVYNEILLQINQIGFRQESNGGAPPERPGRNGRASEPSVFQPAAYQGPLYQAPSAVGPPALQNGTIYGTPQCAAAPFSADGQISVEQAMNQDQQDLLLGGAARRRRRNYRQLRAGLIPDPNALFDEGGRPLLRTRLTCETAGAEVLAEVEAWQDRSYSYQQLHRITVQESVRTDVWMHV